MYPNDKHTRPRTVVSDRELLLSLCIYVCKRETKGGKGAKTSLESRGRNAWGGERTRPARESQGRQVVSVGLAAGDARALTHSLSPFLLARAGGERSARRQLTWRANGDDVDYVTAQRRSTRGCIYQLYRDVYRAAACAVSPTRAPSTRSIPVHC